MAKTFYVTKETTCPKCEGYKFIEPPIWKSYWEWNIKFKIENNRVPTQSEDRDWWADLSYGDPQFGYDPIPSEDTPCPGCDGVGVIVEKVELADALRELEYKVVS